MTMGGMITTTATTIMTSGSSREQQQNGDLDDLDDLDGPQGDLVQRKCLLTRLTINYKWWSQR